VGEDGLRRLPARAELLNDRGCRVHRQAWNRPCSTRSFS